jgi:hypothetical protein
MIILMRHRPSWTIGFTCADIRTFTVLNRNNQVNHFLERHSRESGNPVKKGTVLFFSGKRRG